MITNEWIPGHADYTTALDIRKKVFGALPEYSRMQDQDTFDAYAMHLIVYCDDVPAATGRIYLAEDNRFHIDCIAVLQEYRAQGIGDLLTKLLLYKGFSFAEEIDTCPRETEVSFFKRYGFVQMGREEDRIFLSLEKNNCIYPSKCVHNGGTTE